MATLRVLNPVARSLENPVEPAARIPDLNGKRVGLYWNMKSGGDVALQRTEELLRQHYPGARFAYYQGTAGWMLRHVSPQEAAQIARECDVVIGTTSD